MTFSDLSPFANHLWQSTLFAAVAWVLTLTLRKNRAAVRYWLWLAASVKFLIPFAWVARLGARFAWPATQVDGTARIPVLAEQIGQPFQVLQPAALAAAAAPAAHLWPAVLLVFWICGMAVGVVFWIRSMWRMGGILREAKALDLNLPIPVKATPERMEPGVFGIWRPKLLLPEGITERLTPGQLKTILAHELCHVHRWDNLTAAIHMLVETIFWFHPAVWWIRTRLVEERERACDEGVMRLGSEPRVYAESILEVCEFYLSAPVALTAGVTGGELKKRIEGIMGNRFGLKLGFGKRALLATAALATLILPLALGAIRAGAQTDPAGAQPRFEVASIKPIDPDVPGKVGLDIYPGGRLVIPRAPLKSLVATAFHLSYWQISGGDAWTADDLYNIEAKPPEDMRRSIKNLRHTWFDIEDERLREMLQALLIDRFQLQYHGETKTGNVYLLERSGKTLRLRSSTVPSDPSEGDRPFGGIGFGSIGYAGGQWVLYNVSMPQLAKFASDYHLHVPVLDRTGLSGPFDYRQAVPDDEPAYSGPAHTQSFMNMVSTVGLKLERSKGPVEILVIDKAERPSAN